MSAKITGMLLSTWLLAAGVVAGQGDPTPAKKPASEMYEDIEVFRRLLIDKLNAQLSSPGPYTNATYGGAWKNTAGGGMAGQGGGFGGRGMAGGGMAGGGMAGGAGAGSTQRLYDLEGVYLKGQGALFTATLPYLARNPLGIGTGAAAKPLTDWERARLIVRGEKPAASGRGSKAKGPGLAEVVLKTMADNGRHFRHLADNETLTVVVTFRPAGQPLASPEKGTGGYEVTDMGSGGASRLKGKETVTTARDHELLGDLHSRQGKAQEAIQAYLEAFKLNPSQALLAKVVKSFLALDKNSDPQRTLEIIKKLEAYMNEKKTKDDEKIISTAKTGSRLPAKLIVSASKKLLDQVGSGQLTFEAFRKAATVEFLTFATEKK